MLLTWIIGASVLRTARADAEAQFDQSAEQTARGVQDDIRKCFTAVEDVGALIASVPNATPTQFADYVRTARVFDRLPSLVAVFYLARVDKENLDSFLAAAKAANPAFTPISISPGEEPTWPQYYLVQYVPGHTDLQLPVGSEISSIKAIANLLAVSSQTGRGVVGSFQHDPVLQRIADINQQVPVRDLLAVDFFIGVPVYATQGAREPIGWTAAPVARFQDVVAEAAKGTPQGLGLSLTVDLTDEGMSQRPDLSRVAQVEGSAGPRSSAAFEQERSFQLDGVDFHLTVWSTPDANQPPGTYLILLIGGFLASVMAASVMYLRLRARERERLFADELADRAIFQREIVDSVTDAMVVLDAGGKVVAANPAWSALLTATVPRKVPEDPLAIGSTYSDAIGSHLRSGSHDLAVGVGRILEGDTNEIEIDVPFERGQYRRWYSVRATPLRGIHGGAVIVHTDITEQKRSQDELEFKASHDNLTGLLNRAALLGELDDALRRARAEATRAALLFIDLDGFKQINDSFGHAVGDEVLRAVSTRISTAVRTTDRVARLGGDEFMVLIAPLASPDVATSTAARVLRSFSEPVAVDDLVLTIAASVGIAIVDSPLDVSGTDLMERADEAMYRAKETGGSHFEVAP